MKKVWVCMLLVLTQSFGCAATKEQRVASPSVGSFQVGGDYAEQINPVATDCHQHLEKLRREEARVQRQRRILTFTSAFVTTASVSGVTIMEVSSVSTRTSTLALSSLGLASALVTIATQLLRDPQEIHSQYVARAEHYKRASNMSMAIRSDAPKDTRGLLSFASSDEDAEFEVASGVMWHLNECVSPEPQRPDSNPHKAPAPSKNMEDLIKRMNPLPFP